jgi:hypothetical protein
LQVFNHDFEHLYNFPWDLKNPKAFLRARLQGCMPENNSRLALTATAATHPELLDVAMVKVAGSYVDLVNSGKLQLGSFVPIEEHARWRYLISADGCAASVRVAKVLSMNSVVLKEKSDWIEYYYR